MTPPSLDGGPAESLPWMTEVIPWLKGMGGWGAKGAEGKREPTEFPNVWLREVPLTAGSRMNVGIGSINVAHRQISPWGQTVAHAVIDYALPVAPNSRIQIRLVGVNLDLDITLRPQSRFLQLEDFAPLYRKFKEEYRGDRLAFLRAAAFRLDEDYNRFGTVEGVLFHEVLHGVLAAHSARPRWRGLIRSLSGGSGYETAEDARTALQAQVSTLWTDFHGELVHDGAAFDERFIWEKECAWYLTAYEKAGKPGL